MLFSQSVYFNYFLWIFRMRYQDFTFCLARYMKHPIWILLIMMRLCNIYQNSLANLEMTYLWPEGQEKKTWFSTIEITKSICAAGTFFVTTFTITARGKQGCWGDDGKSQHLYHHLLAQFNFIISTVNLMRAKNFFLALWNWKLSTVGTIYVCVWIITSSAWRRNIFQDWWIRLIGKLSRGRNVSNDDREWLTGNSR